jgi:serine/threonine-protein kinase
LGSIRDIPHNIDGSEPTMHGVPQHLSRSRATLQWAGNGQGPVVHTEPSVQVADVFNVGDRLADQYEIRRLLGSGGMGQVFEAHDLALNRTVALKVAWPHVGFDGLRREAQVLAAFRHPGLVMAHALIKWRNTEFLVMERIQGGPLADLLQRRGKLPLQEAMPILLGVCDALGVLHASGLAHCDLKPANIMLAPGDRVVLLDFGIVRIEQLRGEDGLISGSPHFMAPETIRGKVRTGDAHLVDIYALGVIAYVLTTGRAPFDDPDPLKLMMQHVQRERPRVRQVVSQLPAAFDELVANMMAVAPEERPARIEEVRDQLRHLRK